jgi:fatty-acyl-CoA synthase
LASRAERENLRQQVKAAVLRSCGVNCEVVLVAPRSLPFTSSGKLSRMQAKALYLAGDIAEISSERRRVGMLRVAAAH